MRTCYMCRQSSGNKSRCRDCERIYMREWRNANRQRSRDISNKGNRKAKLKWRYGITVEQYEAMLAEQGGVCALCKNPCATKQRLAVDHDHVTGEVRGLLCMKCNTAIERMDHAGWAEAASSYLGRSSVRSEQGSYKAQVVGSNPTGPTN